MATPRIKPNASGSRGNAASRWMLRATAKRAARKRRRDQDREMIREQR